MPHTREYALRLLGRLELPEEAERILDSASYLDETVWGLYLERCEEQLFHAPDDALKMAQIALRLSLAIPKRPGTEAERKHAELTVMTHAILGGAYRAMGRHEQAEKAYTHAWRLRKKVSRRVQARLCRWLAYLRAAQNRLDKALKLTAKAEDFAETPNALGAALVAKGYVEVKQGNFSEGVRSFSRALSIIRPKDGRSQRLRYSATHNLAYAISRNPSPESLGDARFYIRQARKLLQNQRRSMNLYQLYWIEGELLIKVGSTRRGEKLLKKAQAGFSDIGAAFEIALVGLGLSELYHDEGRWDELEDLAAETYVRFDTLSADAEAVAALKLWKEAVEAETLKNRLISDVRSTLSERRQCYPPPGMRRRRKGR